MLYVVQVRVSEVTGHCLEERRGYLTLALQARKEGKLLLRKTEGIREWQQAVAEQVGLSLSWKTENGAFDFFNKIVNLPMV